MFKPIGSIIKSLPQRSKTPQIILALQIRQAAKEVLCEVCADLPIDVIDGIKVSTFKSGVLTLVAPNLVSAELQMRSEGLIGGVNKELGKKIVKRLRFKNK